MNKSIVENDFLAEIFSEHPSIARFERFDLYDQIFSILKSASDARLKLHITGAQVPHTVHCRFHEFTGSTVRIEVIEGSTEAIPVGTLLACFFTYDGCQGVFFTTLVSRESVSDPTRGVQFTIRTPFNIDLMEARLSQRVKLSADTPFQVKVRKSGKQANLQPVEFGKSGLRVYTEDVFPCKVGDFVEFELKLGETEYPVRAQLRWAHAGNYGFCFEHVLSDTPMRTPNAIERLFWSLEALESCGPNSSS